MRISDWSSDVCASDLGQIVEHDEIELVELGEHGGQAEVAARGLELLDHVGGGAEQDAPPRVDEGMANGGNCVRLAGPALAEQQQVAAVLDPVVTGGEGQEVRFRSEEHTSELQSLMRISYAVFCLKKKKENYINPRPICTNTIYTDKYKDYYSNELLF